MTTEIFWLYDVEVKPGQLPSFAALLGELIEATAAEPGAMTYKWSVSDDGRVVHIYERYVDSAAVLAHMSGLISKVSEQFQSMIEHARFTVYGSPTDEVKQALEPVGAVFMAPFVGIER